MAVSRTRLREVLQPVVDQSGYDLEDVTVTAAGRRSVVRVVVDRDGGVDLDAVADVSRSVSEALDAGDVMGESPYVLEVSSPGVDRPLAQPRHWRRATGRLVRTSLRAGGDITGRVLSADEDVVVFDIDGQERSHTYDEIGPGHIQVEFAREDDR